MDGVVSGIVHVVSPVSTLLVARLLSPADFGLMSLAVIWTRTITLLAELGFGELYSSLLRRYEDAQLAESMEQRQRGEQFRVLDPALAPRELAAPNRVAVVQIGLALALGVAVAAMILAEQLDMSFHTLDDLRAFTKVPVLVSIPLVVTAADIRRWWRFGVAALAFVLALALVARAAHYVASGNDQLVALLSRGRV